MQSDPDSNQAKRHEDLTDPGVRAPSAFEHRGRSVDRREPSCALTPERTRGGPGPRRPLYLTLDSPPARLKDSYLVLVEEWAGGCIICGAAEVRPSLPGSGGALTLPLCARHTRWAMACRAERYGPQAGHLKKLLYAWCRLEGDDRRAAKRWLAG